MSETGNVKDKQIEEALFLAKNRLRWRKYTLFLLAIIIAVTFILSAFSLINYLLSYKQYDRLMADLWQPSVDWATTHQQNAPQDIEVLKLYALARGNNTYDLVAEVKNPNADWILSSVGFQFTGQGSDLGSGKNWLLPGERRYFALLGYKSDSIISAPESLVRFDYVWQRAHQSFEDNWQFTAQPKYSPQQIIIDPNTGLSTSVGAEVTWKAINYTGYSLHQVTWQVALYSGGRLVSVSELQTQNVPYTQEREYALRIFDNLGRVDKVEVFPMADIFSSSNRYLAE